MLLYISDENNHSSIQGIRKARKIWKHNDLKDLEGILMSNTVKLLCLNLSIV